MVPGWPSKAVQQTHVGQGLAVGGVAVTSSKLAVEDTFRRAWGSWGRAGEFPAVRASLERNDILRIAHSSARRHGGSIAFWDTDGRWWEPVLRNDRTPREAAEELAASTGVPVACWAALAEAFVAALGEDDVVRGAAQDDAAGPGALGDDATPG